MIAPTVAPAAALDGKPISKARMVSGALSSRTVTSVTTPSRPSEPTVRPSRS